jgi:hypothetical protein
MKKVFDLRSFLESLWQRASLHLTNVVKDYFEARFTRTLNFSRFTYSIYEKYIAYANQIDKMSAMYRT